MYRTCNGRAFNIGGGGKKKEAVGHGGGWGGWIGWMLTHTRGTDVLYIVFRCGY